MVEHTEKKVERTIAFRDWWWGYKPISHICILTLIYKTKTMYSFLLLCVSHLESNTVSSCWSSVTLWLEFVKGNCSWVDCRLNKEKKLFCGFVLFFYCDVEILELFIHAVQKNDATKFNITSVFLSIITQVLVNLGLGAYKCLKWLFNSALGTIIKFHLFFYLEPALFNSELLSPTFPNMTECSIPFHLTDVGSKAGLWCSRIVAVFRFATKHANDSRF